MFREGLLCVGFGGAPAASIAHEDGVRFGQWCDFSLEEMVPDEETWFVLDARMVGEKE